MRAPRHDHSVRAVLLHQVGDDDETVLFCQGKRCRRKPADANVGNPVVVLQVGEGIQEIAVLEISPVRFADDNGVERRGFRKEGKVGT